MPINKYYKGHGDEVMSNMTKEYGSKKGESVFYALANKNHEKPLEKAKGILSSRRRTKKAA